MQLTLSHGTFAAALAVAATAVKPRATLPVLEHVLLEAADGRLTVSGTDLGSRAWQSIACGVQEAGAVTVPPKALNDFLDAIVPSEPITLTVDAKHKAELVSGRTRIRVAGLDPEQFPPAPAFDEPAFDYTLAASDLTALIRNTVFAAAKDDSRPVLAGILFQVRNGTLKLVAADGFRLALREIAAEGAMDLNVIAHARMLGKLVGHLGKATSARLMVDAGCSSLLVDTEQGSWAVRLIDGQFPDFNRIIPRDAPIAVTAARDDLVRATGLVLNVEQTSGGYTTRLSVGTDGISIQAGTATSDQEVETHLEATLERGEPITIGFNTRYLRDAIESVDADQITIELTRPDAPSIVRADGPRNGHLNIVMPMHVNR